MDVQILQELADWLSQLRDARARVKITARIARLAHDNPGDVAPVGEGVSEMRIHYGPGYRVYYLQHGGSAVVLRGGDKSTQAKDIEAAHALAKRWKDDHP